MLCALCPEKRRELLQQLLILSDDKALDEVSNWITELKTHRLRQAESRDDPFSLLPYPASLYKCLRVSRTWNGMASNTSLWKALCTHPKLYRLTNQEAEEKQLERHTIGEGVCWKDAFSERFKLWRNWNAGRCVVRTFSGHSQMISCVQFDDQRIVSGSSDSTIRVWDHNDSHPLGQMTFTGHSATVRCLHLQGNRLASGSNDFSIKIWNLDKNPQWSSIACRRTMLGHTNYVRCLQMCSDSLVSGSYDCTLRLWSLETGDTIRSFNGHSDSVLCLQYDPLNSFRAVSGSADNSIKVWDARTAQCAMTILNSHEDAVTCVRFDAHRIISGSVDRMIKMWDIRTGRCSNTIDWRFHEGHTGVVRCLQVDAWRIVSASDDRTVKVWNLETSERMCTLQSHTDGVTCVDFDDKRIVSGSYDKQVKLWDFYLC
ncbi:unnamed protein product, partial [Mesorhabditis belari]|uniref:F-box domain-containing protein n=1 Tax=Mesorhabditis belari TaxID=2138241 RepID=A0AAF3JAQ5_9BILA